MSLSRATMSAIRFGYGLRPGETGPTGPEDLMRQLDAARKEALRFPVGGLEQRRADIEALDREFAKLNKIPKDERPVARGKIIDKARILYNIDLHARIEQAALSPNGFAERLAMFWVNHFSVSAQKSKTRFYVALYEAEALRPAMTGSFRELLRAAILHPAMLTYLDQVRSMGPNSPRVKENDKKGLNENLGRELLELHTLGVDGGYGQDDVRNAALVLTGLNVNGRGEVVYQRQRAEPGPIEVLGKSYGGPRRTIKDIEAMLDDLAAAPQTRRHICRKLVVHFVSDKPPTELVEAMTRAWEKTDGDLRSVYQAMLDHPAAWANPSEKARQPFDFVVAGLRATLADEQDFAVPPAKAKAMTEPEMDERETAAPGPAAKTADADDEMMMSDDKMTPAERKKAERAKRARIPHNPLTVRALRNLGQPIWQPSSPAGFPEGFDAWVSASQITGRISWAQRLARRRAGQTDPVKFLKVVLADAARDDTITIVSQAPNRAAGVALTLASPEFNRR
ncbi:DUF1800 domain-containing protein [Rhizobium sp. TRM95796]|uniref:DUF1800 domain-containing protein n=1 Tax=Rhizobium sp. TRM95796 TaxID=2979862 RepID=UPI0021E87EDC|nr:DUF1800 domain-containing protein [Rhizobium sp. TRM95796]MCV3764344.1 DUF1800 domain-containing protein [Rhizobium sp. TRM95796]